MEQIVANYYWLLLVSLPSFKNTSHDIVICRCAMRRMYVCTYVLYDDNGVSWLFDGNDYD